MKWVWKRKGNKYVKRWTFEKDDRLLLGLVLMTALFVAFQLLRDRLGV